MFKRIALVIAMPSINSFIADDQGAEPSPYQTYFSGVLEKRDYFFFEEMAVEGISKKYRSQRVAVYSYGFADNIFNALLPYKVDHHFGYLRLIDSRREHKASHLNR
ncbi:MAG: hypothetical protein A2089_03775 [Elusimicrobia bacterium GWD2_63_28]|nr:MAG: hypothetical protein A2089_03775 [Elusimicrobia bacterium GWD2_63_28]